MVFSHEEHEALLSKLNDPELSAEDRTEVLTDLRNNYSSSLESQETLTETNEKLKTSNDDLIRANAKLFNETGAFLGRDSLDEQEEEQQSVSETITLEDMEEKYRV